MTVIKVPLVQEQPPAEIGTEKCLWDALHKARADREWTAAAALQVALIRMYLPRARAIAHAAVAESGVDVSRAEQSAELGLTQAVTAWPRTTGGSFWSCAQAEILRRLHPDADRPRCD